MYVCMCVLLRLFHDYWCNRNQFNNENVTMGPIFHIESTSHSEVTDEKTQHF
jgi:hypothetical protein